MIYQYKVTYYNDYEGSNNQEEGLVFGMNYGDAANNLYETYKSELVNMYLQEWDCEKTVTLDEIKTGFRLIS